MQQSLPISTPISQLVWNNIPFVPKTACSGANTPAGFPFLLFLSFPFLPSFPLLGFAKLACARSRPSGRMLLLAFPMHGLAPCLSTPGQWSRLVQPESTPRSLGHGAESSSVPRKQPDSSHLQEKADTETRRAPSKLSHLAPLISNTLEAPKEIPQLTAAPHRGCQRPCAPNLPPSIIPVLKK